MPNKGRTPSKSIITRKSKKSEKGKRYRKRNYKFTIIQKTPSLCLEEDYYVCI